MMKLLMLLISMFFISKSKFLLIVPSLFFFIVFIFLMNFNLSAYYWGSIYYLLGMDYLSLLLMILVVWIWGVSMLASKKVLTNLYGMNFYFLMLILLIILMFVFMSINMFMFYIFFEASLIPMVMIIMGWGYQVDRIQASMYMLMYTIFGSLPLLVIMGYMYMNLNSVYFSVLMLSSNLKFSNFFFFMMMMLGGLVKMPLYFIHIWLPKAHVEAPVGGSMVLAGVMLKLGSYMIYRFINMFNSSFSFTYILIGIGMMGSLYSSLICLTQVDMKVIVAYSSVVHMNLMMVGLLCSGDWGNKGSLMIMISHGLNSSMLFYLVNLIYERLHSRSLVIIKGLMSLFPSLSLWWMLGCFSNFSVPPSLSLFGEVYLIVMMLSYSSMMMVMIFFIFFFCACYSIYLYICSNHGLSVKLEQLEMITVCEFLVLILHWVPLNLMFLILMIF